LNSLRPCKFSGIHHFLNDNERFGVTEFIRLKSTQTTAENDVHAAYRYDFDDFVRLCPSPPAGLVAAILLDADGWLATGGSGTERH
jgi:hypothetical protein